MLATLTIDDSIFTGLKKRKNQNLHALLENKLFQFKNLCN